MPEGTCSQWKAQGCLLRFIPRALLRLKGRLPVGFPVKPTWDVAIMRRSCRIKTRGNATRRLPSGLYTIF